MGQTVLKFFMNMKAVLIIYTRKTRKKVIVDFVYVYACATVTSLSASLNLGRICKIISLTINYFEMTSLLIVFFNLYYVRR